MNKPAVWLKVKIVTKTVHGGMVNHALVDGCIELSGMLIALLATTQAVYGQTCKTANPKEASPLKRLSKILSL